MIKSTLIVILLIALAFAAIITRPSEQSARGFLAAGTQPAAASPQTLTGALKDSVAKAAENAEQRLPVGYEFKDRVLWVEVVKDGQTVYTGVLSHWIKHETPAPTSAPRDQEKPVVAGLR